MQMKKEDVRLAILESAQEAFLEKGFEKASLRQIVKKAGTTIGNFYNYFESKEALFETLVLPDYEKLMTLFVDHKNNTALEDLDFLWSIPNPAVWRDVLGKAIEDVMPAFEEGIAILFHASKGTRFEGVTDQMAQYMERHMIEHLEEFGGKDVIGTTEEIQAYVKLISMQFVNGFGEVFRLYSGELRTKMLTEHLLFFMIGIMGLIGDFDKNTKA